jgi:phage shock protein PspC (stress-responsive transcriptional regulator)
MSQRPIPPRPVRQLTRPYDDRVVGGVCAGLARYFNLDPTLVRVLTVLVVVLGFFTPVIAYLVAWALMPES